MKIGYARVSTDEQSLALQEDALQAAGVERIYTDIKSGKNTDRPELQNALKALRAGDTLVVWRLDRLGRSLQDLLAIINSLKNKEIAFQSLHENIETATPSGALTFHLFGALAQFERDLISQRTKAGLVAARARGRKGGRKPKLNAQDKEMIKALIIEGSTPIIDIAKRFNVHRSTVYAVMKQKA